MPTSTLTATAVVALPDLLNPAAQNSASHLLAVGNAVHGLSTHTAPRLQKPAGQGGVKMGTHAGFPSSGKGHFPTHAAVLALPGVRH